MDSLLPVVMRLLIWALIGMAITPLVYLRKGRDGRWGLLTGALAGAVGGLYLLIPLWVLVGRPHKICPECQQPVLARFETCPHCDYPFAPESIPVERVTRGYPEYMFTILLWIIAGVAIIPILYSREDLDPVTGFAAGIVLGVLCGVVGLELMWLLAPREGKRCPDCKRIILASDAVCPHCRYRFADIPLPQSDEGPQPPVRSIMERGFPRLVWRMVDVPWGWLAVGVFVLGLLLMPFGIGPSGTNLLWRAANSMEGVRPSSESAVAPDQGVTRTQIETRFKVMGFVFVPYLHEASGVRGVRGARESEQTWIYLMGPSDDMQLASIVFSRSDGLDDAVKFEQDGNLETLIALLAADETQQSEIQTWIEAQEDVWEEGQAETRIGEWQISVWADRQADVLGIDFEPAP